MNPKLEPLLVRLEQGCSELAKRTKQLAERVAAHEIANAEADQRMAELKRRAQARDRMRFRSEGRR